MHANIKDVFHAGVKLTGANLGPKNHDKNFYVIWRKEPGAGFFSNVFHVLGHIANAKMLGMIPVVDMENFYTFYREDTPIFGTRNAWEYYYKQPGKVSLEEVYNSKNVFFCDGEFVHDIYVNVHTAHALTIEFIRPQKYFFEEISAVKAKFFDNNKVLGVHFRGQEHKTAPLHPSCPSKEQVKSRIDKIISMYPVDYIFVVTEEQTYLDFLQQTYGDKVIFTDAFRTHEENAYFLKKKPRDLHMYKLGLDVMIDTYLLSLATYLVASGKDDVASGSNVSRFAQVLCDGFSYAELIYNGINPQKKQSPLGKMYNAIRKCKTFILR